MKPLKGVHLELTESVLGFLLQALDDVRTRYADELHDDNPAKVIENLEADGWTVEKDSFGTKVYASRPYGVSGQQEQKGELRVGVVLTKKNELKIDIRPWGEY
jgi:hypothetical protein